MLRIGCVPCRSMVGVFGRRAAQLVVAGAIGHRFDRQRQKRSASRPARVGRHREPRTQEDIEQRLAADEAETGQPPVPRGFHKPIRARERRDR